MNTKHLHRLQPAALLVAALSLIGCDAERGGGDALEPFRAAIPAPEVLRIVLPGLSASSQPEGGSGGDATGGAEPGAEPGPRPAQLFSLTAFIARRSNLSVYLMVAPLSAVASETEPVEASEDRVVWSGRVPQREGAGASSHPTDYALEVIREEAAFFRFGLFLRPADRPEAGWRLLIGGNFTRSQRPGEGRGTVWIDLSQDGDPKTEGKILAQWSRLRGARTLTVGLFQATVARPAASSAGDPAGASQGSGDPRAADLLDAVYHYQLDATGAGALTYGSKRYDIDLGGGPGGAPEELEVITRWTATGGSRSDAWVRGGDLKKLGVRLAVLSQCWHAEDRLPVYEALYLRKKEQGLRLEREEGSTDACAPPLRKRAKPLLPDPAKEPVASELPAKGPKPVDFKAR